MFVKAFKNYLFKFLLLAGAMLVIAIPFSLFQIHYPQQAHSINTILTQYSHFFTLFRWSLIVLLIVFWPIFIRHYSKKHDWTVEKTQFWLSQRFRIVGWLIIFELLVCENLLITVLKIL